ncbi:MAG: DNA polymerase III subunit delta [Thermoleophilia bacterium]
MTSSSGEANGAKKQPLKPAYLILGDDRPMVETALRRLRGRIVAESGTELNVDEFSAGQHAAREVIGAANTLAFLAGIRLVLVHGVEQWRKPDKESIVDYLRSPAPDSCLALVGEKLPAGDPLRKAVSAVGDVLEFAAPKGGRLPDWVVRQTKKLGGQIDTATARALVQRVGDDQHLLLRELEKLTTFRGRGHIKVEDVELMCNRTVEAKVFDMVDAVANRSAALVFVSLEELYAAGEKPTGLLFRVMRHFQNLSKAVALREEGFSPAQAQAELGLKPYPAKKVVQQAEAYGVRSIGRAMGVLAETDARMKGKGNLPPELELEMCLGRLLSG